jgi:hypothetical protein
MLSYVESESGRIYQTESPQVWAGPFLKGRRLSNAEGARRHAEQCADDLREIVARGDTVYSVLRHVSASGMSRRIDFYAIKDGRPVWLSGHMSGLLSYKIHKCCGLVVTGCGMDVGFHVVCGLAFKLYGAESALRSEWL